jgi:hypothetical protein
MKDIAEGENNVFVVNKNISMNQIGKGLVVKGEVLLPHHFPFLQQAVVEYLMTTLPVIHLLEFSYADKKAVIERA